MMPLLSERDGMGRVVESQDVYHLEDLPGGYVVEYRSVLDGADLELFLVVVFHCRSSYLLPSKYEMMAMRTYIPFSACLKYHA